MDIEISNSIGFLNSNSIVDYSDSIRGIINVDNNFYVTLSDYLKLVVRLRILELGLSQETRDMILSSDKEIRELALKGINDIELNKLCK